MDLFLTELQESIEKHIPEGYSFKTTTYKKAGTIYTSLTISSPDRMLLARDEDSIYFALRFIDEYFKLI